MAILTLMAATALFLNTLRAEKAGEDLLNEILGNGLIFESSPYGWRCLCVPVSEDDRAKCADTPYMSSYRNVLKYMEPLCGSYAAEQLVLEKDGTGYICVDLKDKPTENFTIPLTYKKKTNTSGTIYWRFRWSHKDKQYVPCEKAQVYAQFILKQSGGDDIASIVMLLKMYDPVKRKYVILKRLYGAL